MTKLLEEMNGIINDHALTVGAKIALLRKINCDNRPGAAAARAARLDYLQRIDRRRAELKARLHSADAKRARQLSISLDRFFPAVLRRALPLADRNRLAMIAPGRSDRKVSKKFVAEIYELKQKAIAADREYADVRAVFGLLDNSIVIVPLRDLLEKYAAGSSTVAARINGWLVRAVETQSVNWHKYSKSWHRKHGPARSVESRTLQIRRLLPDGTVENRDQDLDSWRGNWLLNGLIAAGIIAPTRVSNRLKAVQLHPAFEILRVRKIGKFEIWERRLAGEFFDYCALWHGLTLHAATPKAAIAGLRKKLEAAEIAKTATIDFNLATELGFCETGIRQFAADFGLDSGSRYTPDQIRQALKSAPAEIGKYTPELRKLADAVGEPFQL